jgi:hypothetical protein
MPVRALILSIVLGGVAACGGGGSDECGEDQVEVVYLGGERDEEVVCEPRPATCDNPASCSDTDCLAEMYDFCEAPYIGVACSDTFPPPIISCNP